ncbi:unnamed protein product [Diamesa hyperborea]
MKVTILIYVLCQWYMSSSDAVAIEPSTFGNILASTGRFTNTIKETNAWKHFNGLSMRRSPNSLFPRAMNAVQNLVGSIRQEERITLTIKNGAIRGRFLNYKSGAPGGYFSFQGIKYGKAPVGNRRFRSALPETPWKGTKSATREGSSCPHRNMILENFKGNEDCLFLNVYTPKLPENGLSPKLPVMFWIHGGGFQFGNGNAFLYGPDYLVPEGVILVTINYRLGALGFLNTRSKEAPGNAGLKDIVLALKWVRDNIDTFGGDPNQVTISGQSAGSASVHYLLLSPSAAGLFQRAIAQSGVALNPWAVSSDTRQRAFSLGNVLGYGTNDTQKLVQYLQTVSPQKIVDSSIKTLTDEDVRMNIGLAFVPSVEAVLPNDTDDYEEPFITEDPLVLLKKGYFNKVPLMIGFNSHEAMLFIRRLKKDKKLLQKYDNDFVRLVPTDLNITQGRYSSEADLVADRIRDFYLAGRPITEDTLEEMIFLLTDEMFVRGIMNAAKLNSQYSNSTYFYRFAYDGALGIYKRLLNINRPGICHGDELGYLFYFGIFNVNLDLKSSEATTKRRMIKLWTNFIKYGNPTPNGKDDPTLAIKWDSMDPRNPNQMPFLDISAHLEQKMNPEAERTEFWDDIYEQYNGDLI